MRAQATPYHRYNDHVVIAHGSQPFELPGIETQGCSENCEEWENGIDDNQRIGTVSQSHVDDDNDNDEYRPLGKR